MTTPIKEKNFEIKSAIFHICTDCPFPQRVSALEAENERLRAENTALRSKVTFFDDVTWLASGLKGENTIVEMLGGELTRHNARYDLRAANVTFEIKLSNLNRPVKTASTLRWAWAHLLGADSGKRYDRLILLGEADSRYCCSYADPESPYILFDIPFADVSSLVDKFGIIHLTTNPRKTNTRAAERLYNHYQVTSQQLCERYRVV